MLTPRLITWTVIALASLIPPPATARQAPPATEVYLSSMTREGSQLVLGAPRNISNGPGYDNQPHFAPDGRSVFFTSARGAVSSKCGSPQTDVYRFDIARNHLARVTETADCEYSPTVMPGGSHLSVIRVEPDGTQRLWRFTIDGKNPTVVLENVKPVGYHAWLDDRRLALFVLGRPATLQIADVATGAAEIAASNIGQSIVRMPGGGVSFVQQAADGAGPALTVMQVSIDNGRPVVRPLTTAVPGARQAHLAWTPDGTLLMAHDGSLHAWRAGTSGWRVAADLSALGLRDVSRLAVSPKGEWLALVASQ